MISVSGATLMPIPDTAPRASTVRPARAKATRASLKPLPAPQAGVARRRPPQCLALRERGARRRNRAVRSERSHRESALPLAAQPLEFAVSVYPLGDSSMPPNARTAYRDDHSPSPTGLTVTSSPGPKAAARMTATGSVTWFFVDTRGITFTLATGIGKGRSHERSVLPGFIDSDEQ